MKSLFIFLTSLLCIGSLIGLWRAKRTPPEVIKIYKAVPYEPKSTRATEVENVQSPTSAPVAETEDTVYSDEIQTNEVLSEEEVELMREEDEFWEWFASLDTELSWEDFFEEGEDVVEHETATATEIPYSELARLVREAYEMEWILNEYGIYVDEIGKDVCPKCSGYDFHMIRSLTGGYDEWCCMECEYPGGDVIDFVAWIEDIDEKEAARYLAGRAGLLE